MAEEQSKSVQIEGCSVIYDMGSGLVIAKVQIDKVKEQDINARIMKNEMQDQLTANIMKRGQLESLPFFCPEQWQVGDHIGPPQGKERKGGWLEGSHSNN